MTRRRTPDPAIPRPSATTLLLLVAALAPLLLAACGGGDRTNDNADPGQSYTVRGEVVALPGGGGPTDHLRIRHESIPSFVGFDGNVVGMASMTMPFPTADDVDLSGLAPGDKIEFTLVVRWEGSPGYQITEIHKLPPDTVLDFDRSGEQDAELPGEKEVEGSTPTPP